MNGVNDLGAVDALQVDRCDPEVGMPELALDDDERDALVSHLNGMGVTELMFVPTSAQPPLVTCRGCAQSWRARCRSIPT